MKTIFSPRKNHYLKRVSFFLIAIALVAAMVSCDGEPAPKYDLTMAANPDGCGTATDETGTSPYERNTVVQIKAVPDPCCRFVDWSAPAGAFGNSNNATTTFTMPAEDVTVTANFEPIPPDHFKFYDVYWETAPVIEEVVYLEDQFGAINATVYEPEYFGNPVEKEHAGMPLTPITDPNRHYTLYYLEYEGEPQSWRVTVNNQFQTNVELTVMGPYYLAVPTQKEDHEMAECLDHLLVYEVIQTVGWLQEPMAVIGLHDQFLDDQEVQVWDPAYFANPVRKEHPGGTVAEIQRPDQHYVGYYIEAQSVEEKVQVSNQFDPGGVPQTLDLTYSEFLAVPSQKIDWEQPLDHFMTYWADWAEGPAPGFPVDVQLKDQLVTINATVHGPYIFANPVEKWLDEGVWTPISNWNNHLTFYNIDYDGPWQMWEVTVTNQFDPGVVQTLDVVGPVMLAVPTQKVEHDPPVDLDHFLVYFVDGWNVLPGELELFLYDQFTSEFRSVYAPELFAIPVQKTDASGTTDIKGDEHLVFYWVTGGEFYIPDLPVHNQFGEQFIWVGQGEGEDMLGVPSEKLDVAGPWPWGD